jgi:Transcriptional repressor TCF25
MNVLLALDYHTLMVCRGYGVVDQINLLTWMVQLVDTSDLIPIWYQDDDTANRKTYHSSLCDLPNWSYSYALALFDLHKVMQFMESDQEGEERVVEVKRKADAAIQQAMMRYPSVVGYLLYNLEIDTTGRSFQRDWVTALDFATTHARDVVRHWYSTTDDSIVLSATIKTCDLTSRIFAELNAKLYGEDDVLQWLYDNLIALKEKESTTTTRMDMPLPPNPAIMRYANVNPADYSNKVQTLPPDANIIDNGLLAHAMIIDPRRPRYLRNNHRRERMGGNNDDEIRYDDLGNPFLPRRTAFFGPPTEAIDPDWPMAEVLLRSILPWNYVEGLPPPRR